MTTLVQLKRTVRRLGVLTAAGVLSAGTALVVAPPGASATPPTVNCATTNLQTAMDSTSAGATMTVTGTCSGTYTINHNMTLQGEGTAAVLDGQNSGTTLTVSSGATVEMSHMTITNGNAGATGNGGAINNSGTLTLQNSTVQNSTASSGGGIYNSSTLTLKNTTVSGNTGTVFGGGIYNDGALTMQNSTVSGNSAQDGGGGILSGFGFSPVTLKDTMISGNTATAGTGGGLFDILDNATLQSSTVSGNTAALTGGGITDNAGTTTLVNTTVTNNTAQSGEGGSFGGGIFVFSGTVPLNSSIVSGNTPDNCDPSGNVTGCTG